MRIFAWSWLALQFNTDDSLIMEKLLAVWKKTRFIGWNFISSN